MSDPRAQSHFILHWGCREKPGHYLTYPNGQSLRDFDCDKMQVPRPSQLDGTHIFLPHPEKVGFGAMTYLPATDRTILAWWDRTFDGRPGCNMALIGEGYATSQELWRRLAEQAPRLAAQLKMPEIKRANIRPFSRSEEPQLKGHTP